MEQELKAVAEYSSTAFTSPLIMIYVYIYILWSGVTLIRPLWAEAYPFLYSQAFVTFG